ncbi:MAG: hypothetical protein MHMPM18_000058 [Marteilia pararefringens]
MSPDSRAGDDLQSPAAAAAPLNTSSLNVKLRKVPEASSSVTNRLLRRNSRAADYSNSQFRPSVIGGMSANKRATLLTTVNPILTKNTKTGAGSLTSTADRCQNPEFVSKSKKSLNSLSKMCEKLKLKVFKVSNRHINIEEFCQESIKSLSAVCGEIYRDLRTDKEALLESTLELKQEIMKVELENSVNISDDLL